MPIWIVFGGVGSRCFPLAYTRCQDAPRLLRPSKTLPWIPNWKWATLKHGLRYAKWWIFIGSLPVILTSERSCANSSCSGVNHWQKVPWSKSYCSYLMAVDHTFLTHADFTLDLELMTSRRMSRRRHRTLLQLLSLFIEAISGTSFSQPGP